MKLVDALRLSRTGMAGAQSPIEERDRRPLRASDAPRTIAFAGAGGKTSAMFLLARQLGRPAIVTATTHLGAWQPRLADRHIIVAPGQALPPFELTDRQTTLVTGPIRAGRTTPISDAALAALRSRAEVEGVVVLIEADGARQKPLKAPEAHEPAIPGSVDQVVYVAGLSGLGKPLSPETVHRPEIFAGLSGLALNQPISREALVRVLLHPDGGLKRIPEGARRVALLNQADVPALQSAGFGMASALLDGFDSVLVASLGIDAASPEASEDPEGGPRLPGVHAAHERTCGIVLAAGASTRYGMPKQLLEWRGQPFVRRVATVALECGLSPVIVVTGSHADEVEAVLQDMDVTMARNDAWATGQASSIRAGISSLLSQADAADGHAPHDAGCAIFLLADQPQVDVDVVRAIVARHATTLHSIVAPLIRGDRRANPVLFDRRTFPDLLALEGDVGGRALFSSYEVDYLDWHDERLVMDVDTRADYARLLASDSDPSLPL
jgi:molybdenum cofactor cytidylyltransferase